MWSKGNYKSYDYEVKHYSEPVKKFGYKDSRMTVIVIRKGDKVTFRYERGPDIDAQGKGTLEVLDYLMTVYG